MFHTLIKQCLRSSFTGSRCAVTQQLKCNTHCSVSKLSSFSSQKSKLPLSSGSTQAVKSFSSGVNDSIWKLGKLNHIAIAVPDLEAATAFYRDILRARVSAPQDLPSHGVTTVFIELENTKLELLHPLGEKSPIAKYLQKNKSGGLHHICLEVTDIEAAVKSVAATGVRTLSKTTSIGAHGKPVMFLHPADCNGVLVELEQE